MIIDAITDYSVLHSLLKPETLVAFAKEKGLPYLGIADLMPGGLLDFYLLCKESGIKPILGLRFRTCASLERPSSDTILLYAKNEKGYRQLLHLSSKALTDGFAGGKGNLVCEWMTDENCSDLICVLPIGESPHESKTEDGDNVVRKLQTLFKGRFFFGLYDRHCSIDDIYLALGKKVGFLPLGAFKYAKFNHLKAFRTLRSIAEHSLVDDIFETVYLDESLEGGLARELSESCKTTLNKFVGMIDIDIPTPGLKVPKFAIPQNFESSFDYLVSLCRDGFIRNKKYFETDEKRKACSERMKLEMDVVKRCELADYFLLVYDICKYCDEHNIPRGVGRGSAGGCLIAFLLGISYVNPLQYNLLFERFLNEDRTRPLVFNGEHYLTDAPDIDLDIGQIQRQQVIDFLREKYGHVSKIATYTTLSAKACIKDVIRSFGRTEKEAAIVSSYIEILFGRSDSLPKTFEKNEKFKEWVSRNQEIYDIALLLEDVKKNLSIHAAGIIVSSEEIEKRAPVLLANHSEEEGFKRDTCAAYSLDFAAKAGLLKCDILGIRGLNVLQDCLNLT